MGQRRKGPSDSVERFGEPPSPLLRARMQIIALSFALVFAVLAARLAQLHLNPRYELTAEEQKHIGQIELREPRGEILDRRGVVLATNTEVPSLWADPRAVRDPGRLALLVSAALGMDENQVLGLLTKKDERGNPRKFVWVKRWLHGVSDEALDALVAASGGGLAVKMEPQRLYPHAQTAAHLLGFVNRAGEASEGVELTMNAHLESVPGKKRARKDGRRELLESLTLEHTDPTGGEDVYLTIDLKLQHVLERELDAAMVRNIAPRAMGVIMDPNSGAILALASRPAFDPNRYDEFDPELRKNRALIDVFEPGSVFKIVTTAAVLEHALVTTETKIDCEGGSFRPYPRRSIRDVHKMGVVPFSECFAQSSNIAMIKVAALLGADRMAHWIERFGFGQPTSRDFPVESRGIYRPRAQWSGYSMASLPMGQEIAVTMLQLAKSFAVIANGGFVVEPYFIERSVTRDGTEGYRRVPPPPKRIISPATAETMQRLSHEVVLRGTGKRAQVAEYRMGGKTGTAQMARTDGRGYDPNRFTTVFAGFGPVNNPALVTVIVVQEPDIKNHFGGYVCGPVFKEVMREALIQLNVPEDPMIDPSAKPKPVAPPAPRTPAAPARAQDLLAEDADTVLERFDPAMMEESLAALIEPLDGLELVRPRDDQAAEASPTLPDLRGMTKRQVKAALAPLGVPWDPRGAGWALQQDPPPGTPLRFVSLCSVEFSNQPPVVQDAQRPTL